MDVVLSKGSSASEEGYPLHHRKKERRRFEQEKEGTQFLYT